MKFTKEQAKDLPVDKRRGYICDFHQHNPDQEAVMNTCPNCLYIQDSCGCGVDEICWKCNKTGGLKKDEPFIINKGLSYLDDDYTTYLHAICPKCKAELQIKLKLEK